MVETSYNMYELSKGIQVGSDPLYFHKSELYQTLKFLIMQNCRRMLLPVKMLSCRRITSALPHS